MKLSKNCHLVPLLARRRPSRGSLMPSTSLATLHALVCAFVVVFAFNDLTVLASCKDQTETGAVTYSGIGPNTMFEIDNCIYSSDVSFSDTIIRDAVVLVRDSVFNGNLQFSAILLDNATLNFTNVSFPARSTGTANLLRMSSVMSVSDSTVHLVSSTVEATVASSTRFLVFGGSWSRSTILVDNVTLSVTGGTVFSALAFPGVGSSSNVSVTRTSLTFLTTSTAGKMEALYVSKLDDSVFAVSNVTVLLTAFSFSGQRATALELGGATMQRSRVSVLQSSLTVRVFGAPSGVEELSSIALYVPGDVSDTSFVLYNTTLNVICPFVTSVALFAATVTDSTLDLQRVRIDGGTPSFDSRCTTSRGGLTRVNATLTDNDYTGCGTSVWTAPADVSNLRVLARCNDVNGDDGLTRQSSAFGGGAGTALTTIPCGQCRESLDCNEANSIGVSAELAPLACVCTCDDTKLPPATDSTAWGFNTRCDVVPLPLPPTVTATNSLPLTPSLPSTATPIVETASRTTLPTATSTVTVTRSPSIRSWSATHTSTGSNSLVATPSQSVTRTAAEEAGTLTVTPSQERTRTVTASSPMSASRPFSSTATVDGSTVTPPVGPHRTLTARRTSTAGHSPTETPGGHATVPRTPTVGDISLSGTVLPVPDKERTLTVAPSRSVQRRSRTAAMTPSVPLPTVVLSASAATNFTAALLTNGSNASAAARTLLVAVDSGDARDAPRPAPAAATGFTVNVRFEFAANGTAALPWSAAQGRLAARLAAGVRVAIVSARGLAVELPAALFASEREARELLTRGGAALRLVASVRWGPLDFEPASAVANHVNFTVERAAGPSGSAPAVPLPPVPVRASSALDIVAFVNLAGVALLGRLAPVLALQRHRFYLYHRRSHDGGVYRGPRLFPDAVVLDAELVLAEDSADLPPATDSSSSSSSSGDSGETPAGETDRARRTDAYLNAAAVLNTALLLGAALLAAGGSCAAATVVRNRARQAAKNAPARLLAGDGDGAADADGGTAAAATTRGGGDDDVRVTWRGALGAARLVHGLLAVAGLLFQPCVAAGALLLVGGVDGQARMLGAIAFAVPAVALAALVASGTRRGFAARFVKRFLRSSPTLTGASLPAPLALLVQRSGAWTDAQAVGGRLDDVADDDAGGGARPADSGRGFVACFGALFEPFADARHWYLAVEVALTCGFALCGAAADRSEAPVVGAVLMLVLAVAGVGAVAGLRPCRGAVDQALMTAAHGLNAGAAAAYVAAVGNPESAAAEAVVEGLVGAMECFTIVRLVCDVLDAFCNAKYGIDTAIVIAAERRAAELDANGSALRDTTAPGTHGEVAASSPSELPSTASSTTGDSLKLGPTKHRRPTTLPSSGFGSASRVASSPAAAVGHTPDDDSDDPLAAMLDVPSPGVMDPRRTPLAAEDDDDDL